MPHDFKWSMPKLAYENDSNDIPVGEIVEYQAAKLPPQQEPMTGKYCKLERFCVEDHYLGLFEAFVQDKDGRNWAYLPYGPFTTANDLKTWCQTQCTGEDPLFHTIIDRATGQITGMASYLRINPGIGSIEVGHIHFSPIIQQSRIATESMYLMMRRVFDELGYRRYEWKCNALNAPSCRAAERFGFQFEGIFRQATISKQRNRDTAWFAIIDSDWPLLRSGFEQWLDEGNFDGSGRQLRSLADCIQKA